MGYSIVAPYLRSLTCRMLRNEHNTSREDTLQQTRPEWMVVSSHGMVLLHIAANPQITLRQLSDALGLSQRWAGRIVKDLAEANMLYVERRGLRNQYQVNPNANFRHPTLSHIPLARIIDAVVPEIKARQS